MRSPAPVSASGTRSVWVVLVLAVIVGSVAISPYVLLDVATSRLEVTGELHYALLVSHIFTAMIALVLGPVQFVPAIRAPVLDDAQLRAHFPRCHRADSGAADTAGPDPAHHRRVLPRRPDAR